MPLGLKQMFRLPLRTLQGFSQSQRDLDFSDLPVPNYTILSHRAKKLDVILPMSRNDEPLHLVINSTGLKLRGEGEWKVRKRGYSKCGSWRKVHLAMDAKTGQISAGLMAHQDVNDATVLPDLFGQILADVLGEILGGGATYDIKWARAAIAVIAKRAGRSEWKKYSSYHRCLLVVSLMYRLKALTGNHLWARRVGSRATEIAIRVGILNRITALARPYSVRIA